MKCYQLKFHYYCGSKESRVYATILANTIQELKEKFEEEITTMYERITRNGIRRRKTKEEKWLDVVASVKYIDFKLPFVLKTA
jgi:aspartate/tyrosine/aromatic aminotransferase